MSFDREHHAIRRRWRKSDWESKWDFSRAIIEYCSIRGSDGKEKVKYNSLEEANARRLDQEQRWRIPLRVYKCKTCSKFHLTKKGAYDDKN